MVAVAVNARWGKDVGEAIQKLQGGEPEGGTASEIGPREAVEDLVGTAWVNAHLVGNLNALPSDPLHLIRARPDLLAVPRSLAVQLYNVDPESSLFTDALLRYAQDNRDRGEEPHVGLSSSDLPWRWAPFTREVA